jgi:hypothetical protein
MNRCGLSPAYNRRVRRYYTCEPASYQRARSYECCQTYELTAKHTEGVNELEDIHGWIARQRDIAPNPLLGRINHEKLIGR